MTTTPLNETTRAGTGSKVDEAKQAAASGASEVASTVKDQASSLVESSKQQGAEVARDAKQHAQELMSQTRGELRSQAQDQMRSLAQTVQAIAGQLDDLANGRPQQGMVLDVTNQIASTAHRMGDHLEQGGMDAMMNDVKQFARRRPGAFLAASLIGGVVAGRVLRSTDLRQLAETAKDAVSGSGDQQQSSSPQLGGGAAPAPLPEPRLESPGATGYPGMSE